MESNVLTPDLFPEETAKAKAEREEKEQAKAAQKKPRGVYHDRRGKFTDRATAEKSSLEKENYRLKKNYNYYKRVNKRLSEEFKAEHARVLELEKTIKELTQQYEPTHVQPQGVFTSTEPPIYGMLSRQGNGRRHYEAHNS